MPKFYKWTVEIEVVDTWVADGFNLTDERAHSMVNNDLRWAQGSEIRCKVISKPDDEAIAKEQGYSSVTEFRKDRKKGI